MTNSMTGTDLLLLDILKHAIRGKRFQTISLTEEELTALLNRAEEQKILPLIFDSIYNAGILRHADKQLIARYQERAVTWATRQIEQTNEFLVLLHGMQKARLDPIVMKGLVCRELYPQPMLRMSVDEDLLVDDEQFRPVHDAIVAYGLVPDNGEPHFEEDVEISYHYPNSPLYIELHRRMFLPDQEVYGLFSSVFSDVFEHTTTISVQDMHVRTLSPTDHILFLILHAYKHFLYGGVGIRQLCDIGLFAEANGQLIDWKRITGACQQAGMGKLPAAFFKIMETYLGIDLEKSFIPKEWQETETNIQPLLDDILTGGLMGNNDPNRMHSSNITLGAVASKGQSSHSLSGVVHSLFPSFTYMKKEYAYVGRLPILLPIGWIHRIIKYIFKTTKDNDQSAIATLKIGQQRIHLLKEYGVIE